ncbi:translation protein SH3-like domain-containing protein [Phialemonium atrogriseum]|uniref:Translation protein SH3-like domain-containing protein n=1 Tax=Phialemonium atrogriseum TaxID=1093897 RepID=A0AAJ0C7S8_9PEZI|nr:translation protein SH3-like domain-containing protein [Phialemonium atrogriseum]KAK1769266.1 translation protein SH3-like domain-containing protein [Phialemonium atrogriseum]
MNLTPFTRRPLGCLKTSLRQARQQRLLFRRTLATAAESTTPAHTPPALPDHNFFTVTDPKTKKLRTAFAVYSNTAPGPTPSSAPVLAPAPKNALASLHAAQIARMDPTGARTALFSKANRDSARVGDVLMVTHRRGGEPFAGVLMSIRRAGIDTAILLRGQLTRLGVEMWFKVYNKNVAGVEIVRRRPKRARRARLTYLRQPKHDMGSVDHYVAAWRKSRNVMTTKVGAAAKAAGKAAGAKAKGKK